MNSINGVSPPHPNPRRKRLVTRAAAVLAVVLGLFWALSEWFGPRPLLTGATLVVQNLAASGSRYNGLSYVWLDSERIALVRKRAENSRERDIAIVASDGSKRTLQTIPIANGLPFGRFTSSVSLSPDGRHLLNMHIRSGKTKTSKRTIVREVLAYALPKFSSVSSLAAPVVPIAARWNFPEPVLNATWMDNHRWMQRATSGHSKITLRVGDLRKPGAVKLRAVVGGGRALKHLWTILGVLPNGDLLSCYSQQIILSTPGVLRPVAVRCATVLERLLPQADGSYRSAGIGQVAGAFNYSICLSPDGTRLLWLKSELGGWSGWVRDQWDQFTLLANRAGIRGLPRDSTIAHTLFVTDVNGANQRTVATYKYDWNNVKQGGSVGNFRFSPDGKRISFVYKNTLYVRPIE